MRRFLLNGLAATAALVFMAAKPASASPISISPSSLDANTLMMRGEHLVFEPTHGINGKLLITIGGTNSRPSDFKAVHELAVSMGYHVVALDYPNSVISTTCRKSVDHTCFDRFRKEVVQGIDVSEIVQVDVANSVLYRLRTLLGALRERSSNWKSFFDPSSLDGIDWSRITVVGHSQGSGHAAYLSKLRPLDRVALIAGPQDSFDPELAPWLTIRGATASDRYFALLHSKDFFGAHLQYSVIRALVGGNAKALSQVIISDKEVRDGHMEVIQAKFRDEWIRILR